LLKGIYPFWPNIYQKLPIFAILGALKAHIFKATAEKFSMRVKSWESLPMPNSVKYVKGTDPVGANCYQKIPILAILVAVSPHF